MRKLIPLLSVLFVLMISGITFACPMCKDSLPDPSGQEIVGAPIGFNHSIFLFLSVFLLVSGFVSYICFKAIAETQPRIGFPPKPTDPK